MNIHIEHQQTSNGWMVYLCRQVDLPIFSLRMYLSGGTLLDPATKIGCTRLTNLLFLRHLHETGDDLIIGGDIALGTTSQYRLLSIDSLCEDLPSILQWVAQGLQTFTPKTEDLTHLKFLAEQDILYGRDHADVLGSWMLQELYYGKEHPLQLGAQGSLETIAKITLDDAKTTYAKMQDNHSGTLIFVGDYTMDNLCAQIEHYLPPVFSQPEVQIPSPNPSFGHYMVDKQETSQVDIKILLPTVSSLHHRYWPMEMGVVVLGGMFRSRLNTALRIDSGLTYGVGASLSCNTYFGHLLITTSVETSRVDLALKKCEQIINTCDQNWTVEEFNTTKQHFSQRLVEIQSSNSSIAEFLENWWLEGRDLRTLTTVLAQTQKVTLQEIINSMSLLRHARRLIILSGPTNGISAQIKTPLTAVHPTKLKQGALDV